MVTHTERHLDTRLLQLREQLGSIAVILLQAVVPRHIAKDQHVGRQRTHLQNLGNAQLQAGGVVGVVFRLAINQLTTDVDI